MSTSPPVQELGTTLNRTLKLALDEGDAASLEEAQRLFESYRLRVRVGPNVAASPTRQAALLTAVNTGSRCFGGGVHIELDGDARLLVRHRGCETIAQAVADLGGQVLQVLEGRTSSGSDPMLLIGDCVPATGDGVLRLSFDGWSGAATPPDEEPLAESEEFPLAGVLAGALGVSEAFQFVRGKNVLAARRAVILSLWKPELDARSNPEARGPRVQFLPAKAWLIGLGHLGQAYLWALGMLPYARPEEVELVLQDVDTLQRSNLSTSILTREPDLGQMKTRAMARWCGERGFGSRIVERLFAADFQASPNEPRIALCGVDNPQARACLEEVGFDEIIEAGLGSQGEGYLNLRVHGFPHSDPGGKRTARALWGGMSAPVNEPSAMLSQPGYRDLETRGLDVCGLTTLAGRAVGASFVGTATAALAVAELIRLTMGAHRYALLETSLRNPGVLTSRALPAISNRNAPWILARPITL